MRKLFLKISFLILTIYFSGASLYYFFPFKGMSADEDYMAAIIDKHKRLDSFKQPKIILVGGSNLAFGIDSKLLEQELSKPVVNMGLHVNLGLPFILNEVKESIRDSDVIIISPEYYLGIGNYKLIRHTAELYPPAKKYISMSTAEVIYGRYEMFWDDLQRDVGHLQNVILYFHNPDFVTKAESNSFIYRRTIFNEYGDVVAHLNKKQPAKYKTNGIKYKPYDDFITDMNDFAVYVESKKAAVYFVYPPYPQSCRPEDKNHIRDFEKIISEKLTIKVISTPDDFLFPGYYFFNTSYHLNGTGRKKRTQKLIQLLKAF